MGTKSALPVLTASLALAPMKKELSRNMPGKNSKNLYHSSKHKYKNIELLNLPLYSGFKYSIAPSIWIWQTVTLSSLFCFPWLASAARSFDGVAAALWTKMLSPDLTTFTASSAEEVIGARGNG